MNIIQEEKIIVQDIVSFVFQEKQLKDKENLKSLWSNTKGENVKIQIVQHPVDTIGLLIAWTSITQIKLKKSLISPKLDYIK